MRVMAAYFHLPPSMRQKSAEIAQTARKVLCPRGDVEVTFGTITARRVEE
jgi:hypothetical protein